MENHELADAICQQLSPAALEWWNGACNDYRNQYVILAERDGVEDAVNEIESIVL